MGSHRPVEKKRPDLLVYDVATLASVVVTTCAWNGAAFAAHDGVAMPICGRVVIPPQVELVGWSFPLVVECLLLLAGKMRTPFITKRQTPCQWRRHHPRLRCPRLRR